MTMPEEDDEALATATTDMVLGLTAWRTALRRELRQVWREALGQVGDANLAPIEYSDTGRPGKWKLAGRRLDALDKAVVRCKDFLFELGGNEDPPVFKSEQDGHEYAILDHFLNERAAPFLWFWFEAFDAVEAGTALTIKPGDIPRWMDDQDPVTP